MVKNAEDVFMITAKINVIIFYLNYARDRIKLGSEANEFLTPNNNMWHGPDETIPSRGSYYERNVNKKKKKLLMACSKIFDPT